VEDLVLERQDAKVKHVVQCIGSSSTNKAKDFVAKHCPKTSPKLYNSYEAVYADPEVDVVYIGTPHAFHKKNCLDAIAAGKNVLCEKSFTINSREAREVFEAATQKGVYVHEAMWLRHRPLVHELRRLLYEEKVIGEVFRMFSDFGLRVDIPSLPATSRYKDINLGAGTLLDNGIYPLTWAILTLDPGTPRDSERPEILAAQTHQDGIEVSTTVILNYKKSGRHGIISSTAMSNGEANLVARIHGTNGFIEVEGPVPSVPLSFTVYPSQAGDPDGIYVEKSRGKKYEFPRVGRGFIYEADNTALDILAGKKESDIMPRSETMRVMEIMDEIRRQGGTVYPADRK
jgi:predicted dehydrogenase